MPKATSSASSPDIYSVPAQSPPSSFRTHTKGSGALRRNQACRQCRKRKTKCDAGRPCKGCLRSHAVVVSNLVKQGLPFDHLQAECIYDNDDYSPPPQAMVKPSHLPPGFQPPPLYPNTPPSLFTSPTAPESSYSRQDVYMDMPDLPQYVGGYGHPMTRMNELMPPTTHHPYLIPQPLPLHQTRAYRHYQHNLSPSYQQSPAFQSDRADSVQYNDPRLVWLHSYPQTGSEQSEEGLPRLLWRGQ